MCPLSHLVSEGRTQNTRSADDGEIHKPRKRGTPCARPQHTAAWPSHTPPPAGPHPEAARRARRRGTHHRPATGVPWEGSLPTDGTQARLRPGSRSSRPRRRRRQRVRTATPSRSGRARSDMLMAPSIDRARSTGFIYGSYQAAGTQSPGMSLP